MLAAWSSGHSSTLVAAACSVSVAPAAVGLLHNLRGVGLCELGIKLPVGVFVTVSSRA